MSSLTFRPSSEFGERADRLFAEQRHRILAVVPDADVQHVGSTAVPGSLTKGDLDMNVRVEARWFSGAVAELGKLYEINQPHNWTEAFASFKDDASFDLDLGVQLTVIGSQDDHFVRLRDLLNDNPGLVVKINELKEKHQGGNMESYRADKAELYQQILKDMSKSD